MHQYLMSSMERTILNQIGDILTIIVMQNERCVTKEENLKHFSDHYNTI